MNCGGISSRSGVVALIVLLLHKPTKPGVWFQMDVFSLYEFMFGAGFLGLKYLSRAMRSILRAVGAYKMHSKRT